GLQIVAWNGTAFETLSNGLQNSGFGFGLCAYDSGSGGEKLYVVGSFSSAGAVSNTSHLASWNGIAWEGVASGATNGDCVCCCVWNGKLVVGGGFTSIKGVTANRVATWDGSTIATI